MVPSDLKDEKIRFSGCIWAPTYKPNKILNLMYIVGPLSQAPAVRKLKKGLRAFVNPLGASNRGLTFLSYLYLRVLSVGNPNIILY